MRFAQFISAHRILTISVFAVIYPLLASVALNALPRYIPYAGFLLQRLADFNAVLSVVVQLALHFLPVLVSFCYFPITPRRRQLFSLILISVLYLIIMTPLTLAFGYSVWCRHDPQCF